MLLFKHKNQASSVTIQAYFLYVLQDKGQVIPEEYLFAEVSGRIL